MVDERMMFSHFSSYVFINLFNTVNTRHGQANDQLTSEEDVLYWMSLMVDHELLFEKQEQALKREAFDMEKLRGFRDKSRSYFYTQENEQAFTTYLSELTKGSLQFVMVDGSLVPVPMEGGTDGLMSIVAFHMLKHKEAGVWDKVSACQNDECLALFVNKKGRRKWCSMEVCGNRMKARKHYSKKKEGNVSG